MTRRDAEVSQGKTLLLPSVAAGFTCARVRVIIGHPHPRLGYPAAPALYPISVRRLRVWPPASFPPTSLSSSCLRLVVPITRAHRGLSPPAVTPCLAHKDVIPASAGMTSFEAGGAINQKQAVQRIPCPARFAYQGRPEQ